MHRIKQEYSYVKDIKCKGYVKKMLLMTFSMLHCMQKYAYILHILCCTAHPSQQYAYK